METCVWRPVERGDANALAELFQAVEAVSAVGLESEPEAVRLRLEHPGLDLRQHTRIATDAAGRVVAYAEVCAMGDGPEGFRIRLTSALHPELAGDLSEVVHEWLEEHADQLHRQAAPGQPALAGTRCGDGDRIRLKLLSAAGYELVRRHHVLVRDLDPLPRIPPPSGLVIRPFAVQYDEATRLAHNDAYADSSSALLPDQQLWPQHATGRLSFLSSASLLALIGGEMEHDQVAAFILTLDGGVEAGQRVAVLECLGTRPAWRGRGLARGLVARALDACRSLGFERARLQVNSTNSAALSLYADLGFTDSGGGHAILNRRLASTTPGRAAGRN